MKLIGADLRDFASLQKVQLSTLVMFTYTRRRVPVIPPKCVKSRKNQKVLYTVPEVSHTNRYTRRETGIEAFYGRHQDGKYGHNWLRGRGVIQASDRRSDRRAYRQAAKQMSGGGPVPVSGAGARGVLGQAGRKHLVIPARRRGGDPLRGPPHCGSCRYARPRCVLTGLPHSCPRRRTGSAGRDIHSE